MKDSIISIIGVGCETRGIVDQLKALDLSDTELYTFDVCKKDLDDGKLIPQKNLVALDVPCEDNNKDVTESVCCKASLEMDGALCKYLSCFIACLGNPATEDYLKNFLQKISYKKIKVKLLVVTLPHSSEGAEKRRKSLNFLTSLEELADGIIVVDNDSFQGDSLSEVLEEGNMRVFEIVKALTGSLIKHGMLNFDLNSLSNFLKANSFSKYVDHFSLLGNLTCLKQQINELYKVLPAKYRTVNDISSMILLANYNPHTEEKTFNSFLEDVVLGLMQGINKEAEVNWGLYQDLDMEENSYRLDVFIKCR